MSPSTASLSQHSAPPNFTKHTQQRQDAIDMQKRTDSDIPDHHIIIPAKVPKHFTSHNPVACIDVADIPAPNHEEVPLGNARIACEDSAENSETAEEKEYVAESVGKDERALGNGGGRGVERGCGELAGYEGGGVFERGVAAANQRDCEIQLAHDVAFVDGMLKGLVRLTGLEIGEDQGGPEG
jgi:hypothetical protein